MDWTYLWWLLAGLLVIAGLAGTVLPALPGVPLVFAGLFIGAWISRDALRRSVPYWLMAPSLFFTLMFGPVGLGIYLIGRKLTGKGGWGLAED